MVSVAAQALQGVDAHAAQHFGNLVRPGGDEVRQPLRGDIHIQSARQTWVLSAYSPVALAGIAFLAESAAHGDQSRRSDINGISAQGYGLDYIGAAANSARGNDGAFVPDTLIS